MMSDEIGMPPAGKASGWYPSPNSAGYGEYWDGSRWTGIVRSNTSVTPDEPTAVKVSPPESSGPKPAVIAGWRTIGIGTWIGIVLAALWLLVFLVSSGVSGLLVGAGILALATSIYSIVTGRRSWLRIPSRKAAALVLAGAFVTAMVGGGIAPHTAPNTSTVAHVADGTTEAPTTKESPAPSPGKTAAAAPAPKPTTHQPTVTTKSVTEVQDVAFPQTTVDDPTLAAGTTQVTVAGVPGKQSVTYTVTLTDGVETSRVAVRTLVTSAPIAEITSQGTYVAPVAAPDPAPAPAPAPATITPGAFCADADVGTAGLGANGRTYVCGSKGADANGHYHWNS